MSGAETTVAENVKVGDTMVFKGYTSLDDGQEALLTEGEAIEVLEVKGDGAYVVAPVTDKDKADTIFSEEMETGKGFEAPADVEVSEDEDATAVTEEEAPAPAKPAPKAKARAKPKAKTEAKTEAKAKTDTKAVAKPVEAAAPIEILNTVSVAEILKGQDAKTAAKMLVSRVEETYFTLGGVLRHVEQDGSYKDDGPQYADEKNGFALWCDDQLGVRYRKARYLMNINEKFAGIGIDEARLTQIGWSKAKELCAIPTEQLAADFEGLISFADEHTRDDLVEHIQQKYVEAGSRAGARRDSLSKVQKTRVSFVLFGNDGSVCEKAVAAAKMQVEDGSENAAFAHICARYMEIEGQEISVQEAIQDVERRFGIRLQVLGDATDEAAPAA